MEFGDCLKCYIGVQLEFFLDGLMSGHNCFIYLIQTPLGGHANATHGVTENKMYFIFIFGMQKPFERYSL